jgi:hypothetical protein
MYNYSGRHWRNVPNPEPHLAAEHDRNATPTVEFVFVGVANLKENGPGGASIHAV